MDRSINKSQVSQTSIGRPIIRTLEYETFNPIYMMILLSQSIPRGVMIKLSTLWRVITTDRISLMTFGSLNLRSRR
jgi:hypothetical protein